MTHDQTSLKLVDRCQMNGGRIERSARPTKCSTSRRPSSSSLPRRGEPVSRFAGIGQVHTRDLEAPGTRRPWPGFVRPHDEIATKPNGLLQATVIRTRPPGHRPKVGARSRAFHPTRWIEPGDVSTSTPRVPVLTISRRPVRPHRPLLEQVANLGQLCFWSSAAGGRLFLLAKPHQSENLTMKGTRRTPRSKPTSCRKRP